jgi:hypothetical protein
MGCA